MIDHIGLYIITRESGHLEFSRMETLLRVIDDALEALH